MKKSISKVSALIMMTRPAAGKRGNKRIFADNLPIATKFFVQRYFPNNSIAFTEINITSDGMMYIVTLNDGIKLGFNENGRCEMVDCKMEAVPDTLVPTSVSKFMNTYYPTISLVKIEKAGNGCEVTLSNYATLKFNNAEDVA